MTIDTDYAMASAAARLAILELVAGYGLHFDAAFGPDPDPDWARRFGEIWTPDATFATHPNLVVSKTMPARGRAAIVEVFEAIKLAYPHSHFVRHMTTNTVIDELDVEAGRARARSALIAAGVMGFSELKMHRTGVYFDCFRRDGGRWFIERRDLVYDGPDGPGASPPAGWFGNC